ncbi:hypothetical protein Q1J33_09440 [Staphylococcus epidermidis]
MAEVKLSIEEYHNVVKGLNTLIKKLYEMTKKCSDYKHQRNELINDMAETKRKAEAFDEIVKVLASISKEIVEYPGDNDKQKEVIYKRYDDLFEPMKLLEVNHER